MAILEKTSQKDLILYEILRHPVLCGEFISNIDRISHEEEIEFDPYQKEFVCDFNNYVSICCARAVGKTFSLSFMLIWLILNNVFPNDYVVYIVPNKSQLEPVWTNLVRLFRTNSLLKNWLEQRKGINSSTHTITLLTGSSLICRIAGQSGDGVNVIGLHTPFVIVDEAGYFPWGTWLEAQPIVNYWESGYRLITSGVPTGLRENNVLYHTDRENDAYTKHRISSFQNPRFTDEDEERAVQQYGGRDSEEYAHAVLGEHGSPIFSVFDRRLFEFESYPTYKLNINGIKLGKDINKYYEKISLIPSLPKSTFGVLVGVDLGYTDPTAIVIFAIGSNNRMRIHARVQLDKVSYNIQDKIIDMIDTKFKPGLIGIDEGSSGKAVVHRMMESTDYSHKDYHKRITPINFGASIVIGTDADGEEIKSKIKPLSVSVLQDYSNSHRIVYSSTDPDLISELERMTFTKNATTGDIVYKTLTPKGGQRGEDHFTAAMLCAVLAYYLENESIFARSRKPKLFKARWYN
jgi:hypothetical protein